MAVRVPAAGAQINLHVAGTRRVIADLNDRAAKIRPAFDADETGMQNADGLSVRRFAAGRAGGADAARRPAAGVRRGIIFVAQNSPRRGIGLRQSA